MPAVIEIVLACFLCYLIHAAGTIAFAVPLRVPFDEVGLFVGPRLLQFAGGGVNYRLNAIPLGAYVRFAPPAFETASVFKKVTLGLAGCGATIVLAVICLSPDDAFQMLVCGFKQIVMGAVRPRSHGAELVRSATEFARENGFVAVLGAVATKLTAFNLLPLANLSGGMAIMTILRSIWRNEGVSTALFAVSYVLTVLLMVCWGVAIVYAIS